MVSELRDKAASTLVHYFERAGEGFTGDNHREVRGIVDDIVDAAKEELSAEIIEGLKSARDEVIAAVTGVPPDVLAAGPVGVAESKGDDLSDEQTGGHIGNAPGGA